MRKNASALTTLNVQLKMVPVLVHLATQYIMEPTMVQEVSTQRRITFKYLLSLARMQVLEELHCLVFQKHASEPTLPQTGKW